MKNRKLTIEDLAPFLPHGVKFDGNDHGMGEPYPLKDNVMTGLDQCVTCMLPNGQYDSFDYSSIILRLHPMARITEPILEGGKIPLIELARMACPSVLVWHKPTCINNGYFLNHICTSGENVFTFWHGRFCRENGPPNQIPLFRKLRKWHFDVDDLIRQGLAKPIKIEQ